jgi:uncharacterized protein (DUF1800 family)
LRTGWRRGSVYFDSSLHDDGEKHVLGQTIPAGGGDRDLDQVIDIVCKHPSTASYISTKLVRRFVSDNPPASLVEKVTKVFAQTDGDIKALLRIIFASDEFKASRGMKFKRPFHFIVSCLRATGADTHAHTPLIDYLARMGQGPFQHPTPDGYPDEATPWLGTLLWRWNFAFNLSANQIPSVTLSTERLASAIINSIGADVLPSTLLSYFLGRKGRPEEIGALGDYGNGLNLENEKQRAELFGLVLASPAFQRY